MRIAAKLALTAFFSASLLGLGAGAASAESSSVYHQCVQEQQQLGLLNLDLNLLNQCIAQNSHNK
ncbi:MULTISPECIES: hypothetical protein [unclassified Nocardiopsis]|uniref:hypothetical protein n=1 Tax=unclassified Nocardiopsis TaxID=2649073 RepID=UPI00340C47AD